MENIEAESGKSTKEMGGCWGEVGVIEKDDAHSLI